METPPRSQVHAREGRMTWSRSLNDATPELASRCLVLERQFYRDRAPLAICWTRTLVTLDVQHAIWLQGRAATDVVNATREMLGLGKITDAQNVVVTWTAPEKSKHLAGPDGKAWAADAGIGVDPDGPNGPLKVQIAYKDLGPYQHMGALAKALGLQWGGDFRPKPDSCHVQMPRPA